MLANTPSSRTAMLDKQMRWQEVLVPHIEGRLHMAGEARNAASSCSGLNRSGMSGRRRYGLDPASERPVVAGLGRRRVRRDGASHATEPAAKPQLTARDRVSERDTTVGAHIIPLIRSIWLMLRAAGLTPYRNAPEADRRRAAANPCQPTTGMAGALAGLELSGNPGAEKAEMYSIRQFFAAPRVLAASVTALGLTAGLAVGAPAAHAGTGCTWAPINLVNGWQSEQSTYDTGDPSVCLENDGMVYLSGSVAAPSGGASPPSSAPCRSGTGPRTISTSTCTP